MYYSPLFFLLLQIHIIILIFLLRERCKKKIEEKNCVSVSFMYVCVAENGEMLVFFLVFSPNNSLIDNSHSE